MELQTTKLPRFLPARKPNLPPKSLLDSSAKPSNVANARIKMGYTAESHDRVVV